MHVAPATAAHTQSECGQRQHQHLQAAPPFSAKEAERQRQRRAWDPWRRLRSKAGVDGNVAIVRAVEATPPAGVTVAGEKLYDAPEGNPVQLKVSGDENEFCGVIMTVTAPLCPAVRESAPGETATEKLGVATGGVLMV